MKTALLYTHNRISPEIWKSFAYCLDCAVSNAGDVEVICMSTEVIDVPDYWDLKIWPMQESGLTDCYQKIRRGLDIALGDSVYLIEHDVLYPPTYFTGEPGLLAADAFHYNDNGYTLNHHGFFPHWRKLTSNIVAKRELLIEDFDLRLKWREDGVHITWDEPGGMGEVGKMYDWHCPEPVIDVRHRANLTGYREGDTYLDHVPYWGSSGSWVERLALEDPNG